MRLSSSRFTVLTFFKAGIRCPAILLRMCRNVIAGYCSFGKKFSFTASNHLSSGDRRFLWLKMGEGLHPIGRIFLESTSLPRLVRREESLLRLLPPVLTDAILCLDRHKCSSRQTQVFYVTDTSVLAVRHKCLTRQS